MDTPHLLSSAELAAVAAKLGSLDANGGRERASPVSAWPDGLLHYSPRELWDEVVFLAYGLGWELDTLLDLEHNDRRQLVRAVTKLEQERGIPYE